MELLRVTYRLRVDAARAAQRARELAYEQTVEVPPSVVTDAFVAEQILGRVEEVAPDPRGGARATIAYPVATTALDPAQFVNVLFGNSSLHADVECLDFDAPASLRSALGGPRFGLAGLRKTLGVYDRPLTCTAIKPMGRSPRALAELLREFARAGIDVVKDDHGLADHDFCPFEERVRACLAAADDVADETGHRTVYVPNLIGPPAALARQLRFARDCGARAVMASPALVGLPAFWELCRQQASLPVLAHPAYSGAQRIAPAALFGRLFRLLGADAVIYVSFGSRFDVSRADCRRLAENLAAPWGDVLPALPVPAGGIALESAAEVVAFYGTDAMLLVGGSLQVDPGAVAERSRAFVAAVHRAGAQWRDRNS
jgi:ribulose-bisphosphate carboxylase large chain